MQDVKFIEVASWNDMRVDGFGASRGIVKCEHEKQYYAVSGVAEGGMVCLHVILPDWLGIKLWEMRPPQPLAPKPTMPTKPKKRAKK